MIPPSQPLVTLSALSDWLAKQSVGEPLPLKPDFFRPPGAATPALIDQLFDQLGDADEVSLTGWSFKADGSGAVAVEGLGIVGIGASLQLRFSFAPALAGQFLVVSVAATYPKTDAWHLADFRSDLFLDSISLSITPTEEVMTYYTTAAAVIHAGTLKLQMGVTLPPYEADWLAYGAFQEEGKPGQGITVSDIATLIGVPGVSDMLNDSALGKLFDAPSLTDFRVAFDPGQRTLSEVEVALHIEGPWKFISDKLSVSGMDVSIAVPFQDGAPDAPHAVIVGNMDVMGVGVRIQAQLPELHLVASLRPGIQLALKDWFSHIGIPFPDWLGEPNIDLLQLEVDLSDRSMELDLRVFETIKFIEGAIELESFTVQINAAAGAGWSGQFTALCELGGKHPVLISAAYDSTSTKGMELKASYDHTAANGGDDPGFTIGVWVDKLGTALGITTPECVRDLRLTKFDFTIDCGTRDGSFKLDVIMPLNGVDHAVEIEIDLAHDSAKNRVVRFYLLLDTLRFEIAAEKKELVLSFADTSEHPPSFGIKSLGPWAGQEVVTSLPDLSITVKSALLACLRDGNDKGFVFGGALGVNLSLNSLPLVGKFFSGDSLTIKDLQVIFATSAFTSTTIGSINEDLVQGALHVPVPSGSKDDDAFAKGFHVAGNLIFAGTPRFLQLDAGSSASSPGTNTSGSTQQPAPSQDPKWFAIDCSFGPVHIQRVGLRYHEQRLALVLDADLMMGPLTLSLMGLSLDSSLTSFDLVPDLKGLGIDFSSGGVEIGGALFHGGKDTYSGAIVIRAEQLTLSAFGSYTTLDGKPSLFIYAVLDFPIGGPSFFFVDGLAAGFGVNRNLIVPPIDGIAQFPLVTAAVSHPSYDVIVPQMDAVLPPMAGQNFFALGIKFNSFRLIDGFVMLTVTFGQHVEIDVIGLATLIMPSPDAGADAALAEVQLALKATFLPAEGFLGISAQLTPASFVISRDCHLGGGFAFYTWFSGDHAGDFALTLGGYHPNYHPPAHYPLAPRLSLSWQVTDELSIQGDAYFALVPNAVMAGGHLSAVWQSGSIKAWFNAGLDIFISWKPFHYDASLYIDLGGSCTFHLFGEHTISIDVGADLTIWGPEFSGTAHVHLSIISFTIGFGSTPRFAKPPILWSTFKTSLMPAQPLSIVVQGGLLNGGDAKDSTDLGVVNADTLVLAIECFMPSTEIKLNDRSVFTASEFGITPCDARDISVPFAITLDDGKTPFDGWTFDRIDKNQPSAMWGNNGLIGSDAQLVPNMLCGVTLTAPASREINPSALIDASVFTFDDTDRDSNNNAATALATATTNAPSLPNATMLKALGFDPATVTAQTSYFTRLLRKKDKPLQVLNFQSA